MDNQSFFFLVRHKVCPNDDNSRYNTITNRMYLVYKNGRRMIIGVTIGQLKGGGGMLRRLILEGRISHF